MRVLAKPGVGLGLTLAAGRGMMMDRMEDWAMRVRSVLRVYWKRFLPRIEYVITEFPDTWPRSDSLEPSACVTYMPPLTNYADCA